MHGTVKSQRADKVNAETVVWVALLKPVLTESNNYKDNCDENNSSAVFLNRVPSLQCVIRSVEAQNTRPDLVIYNRKYS